MLPRSPWEQSFADSENEGVPTEESVAEIFAAINPLLPTPHSITLDWHFDIASTASLNELLIEFLIFLELWFQDQLHFLQFFYNFFFSFNGTIYRL